MKTFVLCGCSWAEGIEILPPGVVENKPQDVHGLFLNHWPDYVDYRKTRKYGAKVAQHFNAELIDLSAGGNSNHTIVRTLLEYLSRGGYFSGRDASDLFISVGWSNPQRMEFFDAAYGAYQRCNQLQSALQMVEDNNMMKIEAPTVGPLFVEYFEKSNHPTHYINEWARLNFMLYHVLKTYNIPFMFQQNFCELQPYGGQMYAWYDKKYWDVHHPFLTGESQVMLNTIDRRNWFLCDEQSYAPGIPGTVNDYIREYNKKHSTGKIPTHPVYANAPHSDVHNRHIDAHQYIGFGYCHPNEQGHDVWAKYMIQEIERKFYSQPI